MLNSISIEYGSPQGAVTKEIASSINATAAGTNQMTTAIVGVTRAASAAGSAAVNVLDLVDNLGRQSEILRANVDRFLAKVRAA